MCHFGSFFILWLHSAPLVEPFSPQLYVGSRVHTIIFHLHPGGALFSMPTKKNLFFICSFYFFIFLFFII